MRIDVWGNEVVRGGLEGPVRKKKKKIEEQKRNYVGNTFSPILL